MSTILKYQSIHIRLKFVFILIGLLLLVNINPVAALKLHEKNKSILKLSGIVFALGYLITIKRIIIYAFAISAIIHIMIAIASPHGITFSESNILIKYTEVFANLFVLILIFSELFNEFRKYLQFRICMEQNNG